MEYSKDVMAAVLAADLDLVDAWIQASFSFGPPVSA
jgi:hypothetical protein